MGLVILVLVVVQLKKPAYGRRTIWCVVCADTMNGSDIDELLMQSHGADLYPFKKSKICLSQLLLMTRQASLAPEMASIVDDIEIAPGGKRGIVLHYGKKARKQLVCKRKDVIPYGDKKMIKHGHKIITIEI